MNLVALEMQKQQREMNFTVLKRPVGQWSREEVGKLIGQLKPMTTGIHENPQHPQHLVINGSYSAEIIMRILSISGFDHKIVQGVDHPSLPFSFSP
jgi:hypothetical protein